MKVISKWIVLAFSITSSQFAFAGDIPATTIADNYIGNGDRRGARDVIAPGAEHKYDIQSMVVSRTGTKLKVVINTKFHAVAGKKMRLDNGKYSANPIGLGDLFMAVNPNDPNANPWRPNTLNGRLPDLSYDRFSNHGLNTTHTNWNYAFHIGRKWMQDTKTMINRYTAPTGPGRVWNGGHLVSGFQSSNLKEGSYHDLARNGQVNRLINTSDPHIVRHSMGDVDLHRDAVVFEFDVAGTALATAQQIAFRWTTTAGNDIIEGLVDARTGNRQPVPVPEPSSLIILALGLLFIAQRRNPLTK